MRQRSEVKENQAGTAQSGVSYSGTLLSSIENTVSQVSQVHPCENEQNWNGGYDVASGFPCGDPHTKFYEWKEGLLEHEAFLCDSCAKDLGVL
jgi:hypothetical protein